MGGGGAGGAGGAGGGFGGKGGGPAGPDSPAVGVSNQGGGVPGDTGVPAVIDTRGNLPGPAAAPEGPKITRSVPTAKAARTAGGGTITDVKDPLGLVNKIPVTILG